MRAMDGIIILAVLVAAVLVYVISKLIGAKRGAFVKSANRKSIKALEILEDAGYHYLGGPKKRNVWQSINQKQYERDISCDMLVRKGSKRYLVLIAKSDKEKLHTIDAREKLMLINESFPSDGFLHVTVSSARILLIRHKWSANKDYRMFGRERGYRLLAFLMGIAITVLWWNIRGI